MRLSNKSTRKFLDSLKTQTPALPAPVTSQTLDGFVSFVNANLAPNRHLITSMNGLAKLATKHYPLTWTEEYTARVLRQALDANMLCISSDEAFADYAYEFSLRPYGVVEIVPPPPVVEVPIVKADIRVEVLAGHKFATYHERLIYELHAKDKLNAKAIHDWLKTNDISYLRAGKPQYLSERGIRKMLKRIEREYQNAKDILDTANSGFD